MPIEKIKFINERPVDSVAFSHVDMNLAIKINELIDAYNESTTYLSNQFQDLFKRMREVDDEIILHVKALDNHVVRLTNLESFELNIKK